MGILHDMKRKENHDVTDTEHRRPSGRTFPSPRTWENDGGEECQRLKQRTDLST